MSIEDAQLNRICDERQAGPFIRVTIEELGQVSSNHIEGRRGYSKSARKRLKACNPHGRGKAPVPTLPPVMWDMGADGPANRERLRNEAATDFDPDTGKETPNPNGVRRMRRDTWVTIYTRQDKLSRDQAAKAETLRMAAEGMRERDPLSALPIDRVLGQSDPEASRVDSRAWFRRMWSMVPAASRAVVQRVVLDDQPIWHGNPAMRDRHMQRLRIGLDAIS